MVFGGPVGQLGVVVVTVCGLWVGARLLVDAVVKLARRIGFSELIIGLTVVAIGTSTPELVVTTDAALKGLGDIAVGNVLGSNIYNLTVVLGLVSLLRAVPISESLVRRDGVALLASTLVGGAALVDLRVSRLEGVLLVALFVAYTVYLLRVERATATEPVGLTPASNPTESSDENGRGSFGGRDLLLLLVGLAVVLVSGEYMVRAASALARGVGISEWVIGGTIVAAGTSTPEVAVSVVAIRRGSLGISVGNVFGSNIFNLFGAMGIAAIVRPLSLGGAVMETVGWLLVVSTLVVAALWTGRTLSQGEGALFVCSEFGRWVLGLLGLVG
ncbi:calcium/sodium antiporter [Halorussus halophilus]|uniref:calcium/sodium antiporter n=1 Tax=Halorussus halophilus TaxID=2650975 RepID=UPI0013018442|nr:calcium/sodium antiporter [Halorussus halophilus]